MKWLRILPPNFGIIPYTLRQSNAACWKIHEHPSCQFDDFPRYQLVLKGDFQGHRLPCIEILPASNLHLQVIFAAVNLQDQVRSSHELPWTARFIGDLYGIYGGFINWLVVDQPLWKIWKSNGMINPNLWENKSHVPNHQPVKDLWVALQLHWDVAPIVSQLNAADARST